MSLKVLGGTTGISLPSELKGAHGKCLLQTASRDHLALHVKLLHHISPELRPALAGAEPQESLTIVRSPVQGCVALVVLEAAVLLGKGHLQ